MAESLSDKNESSEYDLGILFVHGIGLQTRGDTLVTFGEALYKWIARWIGGVVDGESKQYVHVSDASLVQDPTDPSAPACAELTLQIPAAGTKTSRKTWLLAESWWAQAFATPTYRSLAFWGLQVIPWTFASHFCTRLSRAGTRLDRTRATATLSAWIWNLVRALLETIYLLFGLALMPPVVLFEFCLLIVGLLPIPKIRSAVGWLQRRLSGTLGDSYVLLGSPIQAAAIVGQVRRDLAWLSKRCKAVAVVAHSQGAAIAHDAIRSFAPNRLRLLITLGSGLNKLAEIRAIVNSDERWKPYLASLGVLVLALSVPSIFAAVFATGLSGLGAVLGYVVFWVAGASVMASKATTELSIKADVGHAQARGKYEKRLRTVFGMTLLMVAFGLLGFFIFEVFNKADDTALLFIAGYVLITAGVYPIFERHRPKPEQFKLASHVTWLDFYSSADPVPNGPLFDEVPESLMRSSMVHNQGSLLTDHTTYWNNYDGFVGPVACALADIDGMHLDELKESDRQRLEVAEHRRAWRVGWLSTARAIVMLVTVLVSAALWSNLPLTWAQLHNASSFWRYLQWAASAMLDGANTFASKTIGLLPFINGTWELPKPAAVVVMAVFVLALAWYLVLLWIWRWWDQRDINRLFSREGYHISEAGFLEFLLLLIAGVEIGALVGIGWAKGIPSGVVRTFLLGGLIQFYMALWAIIKVMRGKANWNFQAYVRTVLTGTLAIAIFFMPAMVYLATYCSAVWCGWEEIALYSGGRLMDVLSLMSFLVLLAAWALWRSPVGVRMRGWIELWSCAGPTDLAWARLRAQTISQELEKYERILKVLREHGVEIIEQGTKKAEVEEMKAGLEEAIVALAKEGETVASILRDDTLKLGQQLSASLTAKLQKAEATAIVNTQQLQHGSA